MRSKDIETVRSTYDQIAVAYFEQRNQVANLPYLEQMAGHMPPGGTVLDLGCGGGVPIDAWLVKQGFMVHGLDFSHRMVALAQANVPSATFEIANMLDLRDSQFAVDAVVSFYAIFHTPRERHEEILNRISTFLPLNGALLITMGAEGWEGEEQFFNTAMHWSHYGAEHNRRIIESAGFEILRDTIDQSNGEAHQVILARRR